MYVGALALTSDDRIIMSGNGIGSKELKLWGVLEKKLLFQFENEFNTEMVFGTRKDH